MSQAKKVAIIGSGNLGQALAYRLVSSGYQVTIGSRTPQRQNFTTTLDDSIMKEVHVGTVKNCFLIPDISVVFLAIHHRNAADLLSPIRTLLSGKILVDASNRTEPCQTGSNAEELASHFPEARIVKGFNTLSANALQSDIAVEDVHRVHLAADDVAARETVACIVKDIGFCPVYVGDLQAARRIEAYPLQVLPGWGGPTVISCAIFFVWLGIMVIKYSVKYAKSKESFPWERIPLTLLNLLVCLTAITLLAITYLPGCLAAFAQLYNGTKYKLFPSWLDFWLRCRKMLGLFALLFSVWHAIMSIAFLSPGSMRWWYEPITDWKANSTNAVHRYRLNATGESALTLGILSLLLLILTGLSSLPSLSAVFNWGEWRLIQSHVGYTALFLAVVHVFAMSSRGWLMHSTSFFYWNSFLCCVLPCLVLAMKLFLMLPCVSHLLSRIRDGKDRRPFLRGRGERKCVDIQLLENDTV